MGRYVRSTFVEDQSEFVENLQIGKQIGKLLDMPKRPQAQKHIFWVWTMKNLKMGPVGPRGLAPNPFSTVSPCPPVFFCSGNNAVPKIIMRIY